MVPVNPINAQFRVLYFGTYRDEYTRNKIMIEGLRLNDVDVIECHQRLWKNLDDRINLTKGGWLSPLFGIRLLRTYFLLLWKLIKSRPYDLIVVGYPGQFDVFLARLIALFFRKPLCWDVLMSIYLVALERRLDKYSQVTIKLIKWVEKVACSLPDMMILESTEYIDFFIKTHNADPDKFWIVPLGANELKIKPLPPILHFSKSLDHPFNVLYWGSFIRSHGLEIMIEAANLLREDSTIQFMFIGDGPERERIRRIATELHLKNVNFPGWLDDDLLFEKIANANLCLGVFGETLQSFMTVQNRIYECLALRKPLISGEGPLISRSFKHMEHLYLCKRDANSLAEGILYLSENHNVCEEMAERGYKAFIQNYSVQKIGFQFKQGLTKLLESTEST